VFRSTIKGRWAIRPKKTILCVDDNELLGSVRKFLLETKGYRVISAISGADALVIFRAIGIDLVLTDLIMPNMDGNELVRQVKRISAWTPTIITSGCLHSFDRASQADAFLPKGTSVQELIRRVGVLAMRKRGPRKAAVVVKG
jgi:CheY-like chemotaxis protein